MKKGRKQHGNYGTAEKQEEHTAGSNKKPVEDNIVNDILTAARYASSAANRQPLSYIVVRSPEIVKQVFDCTRWAGYFPR